MKSDKSSSLFPYCMKEVNSDIPQDMKYPILYLCTLRFLYRNFQIPHPLYPKQQAPDILQIDFSGKQKEDKSEGYSPYSRYRQKRYLYHGISKIGYIHRPAKKEKYFVLPVTEQSPFQKLSV